MKKQTTNTILMIEPVSFGFNEETAKNNFFQKKDNRDAVLVQGQALKEFNEMVKILQENEVEVIVVQDTKEPHTPDSIFPNNWITFHEDGRVALYPMFAENRRGERREDILEELEERGYEITEVVDYTEAEEEDIFLEGTGSMILDRANEIAYTALSPRTDEDLFVEFCEDFEFSPVLFSANQSVDGERKPIYHTNVMMSVADKYAIVCLNSIDNKKEKKEVVDFLKESGKEIIALTEEQINNFAGNMLQIENKKGEKLLVMSKSAHSVLTQEQISSLEKYNKILAMDIATIEQYGGGSARCMMAEIFLPKR